MFGFKPGATARQRVDPKNDYKNVNKGTGSQEKKRWWPTGQTLQNSHAELEKKITYIFKPWKQMVDKRGKTEALARLKASTMNNRISKSDKRFMECVDAEEFMSFCKKKKQGISFNSRAAKASKDAWLQHDGMELDELSDKNFGLMKTKVDKMEMEPELRIFFQEPG